MPPRPKTDKPAVREAFADDLADEKEALRALLKQGLQATKKARGWCPNCKKAVYVEVTDTGAAVKVAEFFANQGLGRPGEDKSGSSGSGDFVVSRYVVEPGGADET